MTDPPAWVVIVRDVNRNSVLCIALYAQLQCISTTAEQSEHFLFICMRALLDAHVLHYGADSRPVKALGDAQSLKKLSSF